MNAWATADRGGGYDLLLDLAGRRTRGALEDALRAAVRTGRLAPGTRLPSSRALARDLGVARNTVAGAYAQLAAEGWLTARQGSGTSVPRRVPAEPQPAQPPAPEEPRTGPAELVAFASGLPYVLWPGSPDLSAFPRTAWARAARRALMTAPSRAFGYGDPRGRPELRTALAAYLARARGVTADPDHLVICTGWAQAAGLLGRVLHARGARRVAVEEVGLPDTRTLLRTVGLTPVPLVVDDGGARVPDLAAARADAVFLTPAHQFPMGVPLAPERRTAVAAWARETGGLVVEDDYDGEFRYDRQPVGALQGLAPEHVAYAGTASKSLAPGLRLAWLVVPPELLDAVVREKRLADHQSPVLDQLTLAEFIGSGAYDRHVRRMRQRYRARRDRLVAALAERVPGARVTGVAAGLHALVELPPQAGPLDDVIRRAHRRGLALGGLPTFGGPEDGPPALVIGYGTPPEHAFAGALDLLCDVLSEGGSR